MESKKRRRRRRLASFFPDGPRGGKIERGHHEERKRKEIGERREEIGERAEDEGEDVRG